MKITHLHLVISPVTLNRSSHGVVHHDVLPGQLEQHGIVEELVDGDIFTESLSPPRFDHELSRQCSGRLGLQWTNGDGLVQGIAGHNLPMVEHREAEGLALSVRTQVSLKAKGVDGRDKCLKKESREIVIASSLMSR